MFPAGVTTRKIEVGPALDLTSSVSYAIRVMIEPSRALIWNSEPVLGPLKVYTIPAGEAGFIELPVTNQSGYRDEKGNVIDLEPGQHAFYYKMSVFYLRNGSVVKQNPAARVILPAGSGNVDIDEMVHYTSSVAGGTISVPDLWTSQLAAAEAAAEAAANSAAEVSEALEDLEEFVGESVQDWFDAHPESVVSPQSLSDAIEAHENDPTPHKAYDVDMPNLTVLFENGLV